MTFVVTTNFANIVEGEYDTEEAAEAEAWRLQQRADAIPVVGASYIVQEAAEAMRRRNEALAQIAADSIRRNHDLAA